ncbi:hypothetical protein PMAYCL1PPCAC_02450, partial [Pristionchus mayeri]
VSARISVRVSDSHVKICSLRVSVKGEAIVKWTETETVSATTRTKYFSSQHGYLSRSDCLLSPPEGEKTMYLQGGLCTSFHLFLLPPSCDSSYKKGYGKIKYSCKAEVVRPFLRCNISTKKELVVHRPVDLRSLWTPPTPITQSIQTRFFPFKKGSISMTGIIEHTCYLPGETIHVEASIYNRAPRTIKYIAMHLVESTTYTAFRNSCSYQRVTKNRLVNITQDLQITTGADYFYSRDLVIPQFIPIHNTCPYIEVIYYVKLRISTSSFFGTSLSVKIPLVIGTIPKFHSNPRSTTVTSQAVPLKLGDESSEVLFRSLSQSTIDAPDFSKYTDRSPLTR